MKERNAGLIIGVILLASCALIGSFVWINFSTGVLAPPSGAGSIPGERIAIQKTTGNATAATITVYAQSTGSGPVAFDSAIVKDYQGSVVEVVDDTSIDDNDSDATDMPQVGTKLTRLDITVAAGALADGETYTVTLVSTAGNSFASQSFEAVA